MADLMPHADVVYALPDSLRQALLAYLVTRPYAEVAQGVQALQALVPVASAAGGV